MKLLCVLATCLFMASCAGTHCEPSFVPYETPRAGYLPPADYVRKAREHARATFKDYRDADFTHVATQITAYQGNMVSSRKVKVCLSRSEREWYAPHHRWSTQLEFVQSASGRLLSAYRISGVGMTHAIDELNFATELEEGRGPFLFEGGQVRAAAGTKEQLEKYKRRELRLFSPPGPVSSQHEFKFSRPRP